MEEVVEMIEEKIAEIFEGIENGKKESLEKLKRLKEYLQDICEFLSFVEDGDTIESIKKKLESLGENYEKLLLENFRAVG